jgi:hypothetical protein
MARQRVGDKKVAKYRALTGLPVLAALVRGGTDHRVDLLLADGSVMDWYPKTGEMEKAEGLTWDMKEWSSQQLSEQETLWTRSDGYQVRIEAT